MEKKAFIGTFSELQEKLNFILESGTQINDVKYISTLIDVPSFVNDNIIHVFIISTKSIK